MPRMISGLRGRACRSPHVVRSAGLFWDKREVRLRFLDRASEGRAIHQASEIRRGVRVARRRTAVTMLA